MARRRLQGSSGIPYPRKNKDWFGLLSFNGAVAVGTPQCAWAILPSVIDFELTSPTLMFSRIAFQLSTLSSAATNGSIVGIGLIAWNYQSDTVPTECPRPLSDDKSDWILNYQFPITSGFPVGTYVSGFDAHIQVSKARRKLENYRSLLWCVEALGAVNWNFHLHGRALLAE